MIIDVHVHLGPDGVFDGNFDEASLLRGIEDNHVDISIIQPGTEVFYEPVCQQHDNIARFIAAHPGRAVGMANPNPHLPEELYRREVTRCVRELGFVGIKIQTLGHAVGIGSRSAQKVYSVAEELGVPVMIHTGPGSAFTTPLAAITVAKAHPHLPLVLVHAGANGGGHEAMTAALACPNIYLETTWAPYMFLREAIAKLGAGRIMFGSDHPANIPIELAKFYTLKLNDRDLEMCLSGTAKNIYKLS